MSEDSAEKFTGGVERLLKKPVSIGSGEFEEVRIVYAEERVEVKREVGVVLMRR